MSSHLTTKEAAHRMGMSPEEVRNLCKRGLLPGASRANANGPWRIPVAAVDVWLQQHPPTSTPVTWWQRLRRYFTRSRVAVGAILGLLIALISPVADWSSAKQQLYEWGLLQAFPAANDNETLIVIFTFQYTEGVTNTGAHNEIRWAIEQARAELNVPHLRIEVEPVRLEVDDRKQAEAIGKRHNASMLIWGIDTGARVRITQQV
jgi:hypothetical protein